ncbi:glyoxalase family protein [delta proteobacterium NaphS2]|nr:glyoxalase family protein [delta proteobacterium NaphS2]
MRFILAAWFISAVGFGCAGPQVVLPDVSNAPKSIRHAGKFVWFDLFTRDLPGACRFYGKLFGWSFLDTAPGNSNVKTISNNGIPMGNAIQLKSEMDKAVTSKWIGFMSVADVDRAVERITKNGGTIHIPPKEVPNRGRLAVALDPEGAPFAVLTASKGDPPDKPCVPNGWVGSELWTRNVKEALKFYGNLVGYEAETRKMGAAPACLLLMRDGQVRGGVAKIEWKDVKPNWVPYIGVTDIEAVVIKAEKLGGKVLIGLDPDREDDVAVLARVSSRGVSPLSSGARPQTSQTAGPDAAKTPQADAEIGSGKIVDCLLIYSLTKDKRSMIITFFGTWRSLEAHLNGVQGVRSSNLRVPTTKYLIKRAS